MTHADLVARDVRWLSGTRGCGVVLTRPNNWSFELPDAIGFYADGFSVLVECKVSRADFHRDKSKFHRLFPEMGAGSHRFYLTPPGLLQREEVPHPWGLLECHSRILRKVKDAVFQANRCRDTELRLLLAHIRKGCPPENLTGEVELEEGCLPDVGL